MIRFPLCQASCRIFETAYWRSQAKRQGAPVPGNRLPRSEDWDSATKLAVIIETASLNQAQFSDCCRHKGLYIEQIEQSKESISFGLSDPEVTNSLTSKQAKKRIKTLEKELRRKDKALAEAAVHSGARLARACEIIGISLRTLERWRPIKLGKIIEDQRPYAQRPDPAHKLSNEEVKQVIAASQEPEYASLPPSQIVLKLADKGIYIASESSFYRAFKSGGFTS